MSDVPQQTEPDLHAIFGIDGQPVAGEQPVISVERPDGELDASAGDQAVLGDQAPDAGVAGEHAVEIERDGGSEQLPGGDETVELEGAPEDGPAPGAGADQALGITTPTRRGSSPRFLTDVLVDMGLATR